MTLDCPPTLPADAGLFLDFDGTLVALAQTPDGVVVDAALRVLLADLARRLEGRVAIVSGRSIAQIDALLGAAADGLAVVGSHGAERRLAGRIDRPARPPEIDVAERAFDDFAARHPGTIVERKTLGVALHYRLNPAAGNDADSLARVLAERHGLHHQSGKMMAELRTGGADKGTAIAGLLAEPLFAGSRPVFLGDDVTDEPGFAAVRDAGGIGILVGEERQTAAGHRLADVAAVRRWLDVAATAGTVPAAGAGVGA